MAMTRTMFSLRRPWSSLLWLCALTFFVRTTAFKRELYHTNYSDLRRASRFALRVRLLACQVLGSTGSCIDSNAYARSDAVTEAMQAGSRVRTARKPFAHRAMERPRDVLSAALGRKKVGTWIATTVLGFIDDLSTSSELRPRRRTTVELARRP